MKRFQKNVGKARSKDSLKAFSKLTTLVDGEPRDRQRPAAHRPPRGPRVGRRGRSGRATCCTSGSAATARASSPIGGRCSSRSSSSTWRARSSASAASAPAAGSRSCEAVTTVTRCSSRSRRRRRRCSSRTSARARTRTTGAGSSRASGSRRRRATSSSAGTAATGSTDEHRDFYVRQLWDGKLSAQIELMEPEVLEVYGEICASTLARAHARSGDRIAIAAYLGSGSAFDRAIAQLRRCATRSRTSATTKRWSRRSRPGSSRRTASEMRAPERRVRRACARRPARPGSGRAAWPGRALRRLP